MQIPAKCIIFRAMNKAKHFIREWRRFRGMTMEQLAVRAGMSKIALSRVELGAQRYNQDQLEAISMVLRCEPADLIIRDPGAPDISQTWLRLAPEAQELGARMIEALASSAPSALDGAFSSRSAEEQIIGCMMYDNSAGLIMEQSELTADMFQDDVLAVLFDTICDEVSDGTFRPTDPVTVSRLFLAGRAAETARRGIAWSDIKITYELRGDIGYLAELVADAPPNSALPDLAAEVAAEAIRLSVRSRPLRA